MIEKICVFMHEKSTPHFKYILAVMMRITIKNKPRPKYAIDDNITLSYGILHVNRLKYRFSMINFESKNNSNLIYTNINQLAVFPIIHHSLF